MSQPQSPQTEPPSWRQPWNKLECGHLQGSSSFCPGSDAIAVGAGMATALSKMDQTNMMHLFRAFSEKDAPAMADATLAFSGASQSCPDPLAFRTHVQVCLACDSVLM